MCCGLLGARQLYPVGPVGATLTQALCCGSTSWGSSDSRGQELTEQGFPHQAEQMKVVGGQWALSGSWIHFAEKSLRCRDQNLLEGGKGQTSLPAKYIPPTHACQKAKEGLLHPGLAKGEQVLETGPNPVPAICELCDP